MLAAQGTLLVVVWTRRTGYVTHAATGAKLGGTSVLMSGTLPAFVQEEPARSGLRQHGEIAMGDLIVDCDPDAAVTLFDGQVESGVTSLEALDAPYFVLHGRHYVQKSVGGRLAQSWDATLAGRRMERTLLLTLSK